MTKDSIRYEQIEDEIVSDEPGDEALENAATSGKEKAGRYTLGFCTNMSTCPY